MNITSNHAAIAKKAGFANEFEYWAETRCGHLMPKRCSDDHIKLARALVDLTVGRIPNNRLWVHGYRAMGKTRWVGPIWTPWLICETDIPLIQIVSQSGGPTGLSTQIAKQIKQELADPLNIADYGYRKGAEWSQEHFEVVRADRSTCNVFCRGKYSTIRGQRGMVIFEDIQDIDDVQSEAMLERDEEWFLGDAINVPGPGDPVLWISNYLSPVSLAAKVEALEGWTGLRFYAEKGENHDTFESTWPEMYSNEYLRFKYGELGRDRYCAEFRLKPRVSGNPVFLPEWFRYYKPASDPRFERMMQSEHYTTVGYDGADSVATAADKTAIVSVSAQAWLTDPDIFVREVFDGHLSLPVGIEKLAGIVERMQSNETIVESRVKEGNQGPQEEEIARLERIEGKNLRVTIERPIKDKVTRALYVQGLFQRNKIHFDQSDPMHQRLMTQLTLFTGSQLAHDDLVDAIVKAVTAMMDWTKRKRSLPTTTKYDETTGVPIEQAPMVAEAVNFGL
jgi:predicted phage terminase large subunit-like protein